MGANPHANGGHLKKALRLPAFQEYACKVDKPGSQEAENARPLGASLRDVMKSCSCRLMRGIHCSARN